MSLIGMMPVVNITNKTIKVVTTAKFMPINIKPLAIFLGFLGLEKPIAKSDMPKVNVKIKPTKISSGTKKMVNTIIMPVMNDK